MSVGASLARLVGGRSAAEAVAERAEAPGSLTPPVPNAPVPNAPVPNAPGPTRRERSLGGGEAILREVLAEKVLHGWMQNRHQVLFPLTLNLRSMAPERSGLLAAMMAVAVLAPGMAVSETAESETAGRGRAFLRGAGGDEAVLAAFAEALARPPALSGVISALLEAEMAAFAYVVALVVLDTREAVGLHFLDYLALRLGLPATVVRSATRRYAR